MSMLIGAYMTKRFGRWAFAAWMVYEAAGLALVALGAGWTLST